MWSKSLGRHLARFLHFTGVIHASMFVRRKLFDRHSVYILYYHHVVEDGHSDSLGDRVEASYFRRQLRSLKKYYEIITLEDAVRYLKKDRLERDYVVITFDDGYLNNYRVAFPILKELNIPATVFLIAGYVGTTHLPWYDLFKFYLEHIDRTEIHSIRTSVTDPQIDFLISQIEVILNGCNRKDIQLEKATDLLKTIDESVKQRLLELLQEHSQNLPAISEDCRLMTWMHAREMRKNSITVGSHTISHPILTKVSVNQLWKELKGSKEIIENQLRAPCHFFAYPNGREEDFDDQAIAYLKEAGYSGACTTSYGGNQAGVELFALRRIGIANTEPALILAKLSGVLTPFFYIRRQMQRIRRILGFGNFSNSGVVQS